MTADVKENYLVLGYQDGQGNPVAVGYADRLYALELAAQGVKREAGLKRVLFQLMEGGRELNF